MNLSIATAQFPVSAEISRNSEHIISQMTRASEQGADVVHFCEGAMSGYAGVDFESFETVDWHELKAETLRVMAMAGELRIRLLLGSSHPLSAGHKPHNSVYVIDENGRLVTRYDKRFVYSPGALDAGELEHFTPGDHCTVFPMKGVRCGILICHEYRYPELYRELKKMGVQIVFHSFHAGNVDADRLQQMEAEVGVENRARNAGSTLPEITMPAVMTARASSNYLWISCANTSARESQWPAFVVRPDGVTVSRLRRNTKGIVITEIDPDGDFYDSTRVWRQRAMDGTFYSGKLVRDRRSQNLCDL